MSIEVRAEAVKGRKAVKIYLSTKRDLLEEDSEFGKKQ